MALTTPIAPILYDDPIAAYQELSAAIPIGQRYVQEFDYSVAELPSCVGSAYLEDIYPLSPVYDGDLDSWEVSQGSLAYCGSASAICAYAEIPKDSQWSIEGAIYPPARSDNGLYLVRFADPDDAFGVKWCAIDSRVPVDASNRYRIMHMSNGASLAPALILKALCTMRGGNYDTITNTEPPFKIRSAYFPSIVINCPDFASYKEALDHGGLSVFTIAQQYDDAGNKITPPGVVYGHAFAAVNPIAGSDYQLVRCENPWGGGSDLVSPYSEGSQFWIDHPELAEYKAKASATGGNFWVDWEMFKKLTGEQSFNVTVALPYPKYPIVTQYQQVNDGTISIADQTSTATRVAKIHNSTPPEKRLKLVVDAPKKLFFNLMWTSGNGSRYTSLKLVNAAGTIVYSLSDASPGRRELRSIDVAAGEYYLVGYSKTWDSDRGNLQIVCY